ncbi:hypothetical protein CBR_g53938 [Chara braunii]|uniref:Myb-like domain-containing protein n=1 Tax=Chara braunii TaxID=69332 RepID=A0A388MBF3_CHABU|nr:hypothetical protein CBR_g53938 [Chara braunii]|eukprot:GBG91880.1 hypothetical protein CBR_g53938 [Chara braunii]
MAGMQARAVLPAAEGGRKPATTEPSQRNDPSMYNHPPSWETPLPPSDAEPEGDELPTFPLGSGSTQLLLQTVLAGGSASNGRGEYTTLLQQGLGDDDGGGVDLRFGLCSGSGREPSRTFIIDADPSPRGVQQSGSRHTEQSTLRGDASVTGALSVENITQGVSNMRAHNNGGDDNGGGGDDADKRFGEDVEAGDDDDLGKTGGRGRGRSRGVVRGRSVGRGGRGGVSDDGVKSATYWSPEEQMQLVRCKREQEMHLAGLGHNYGRMRTKEWKWDDIAKHMVNAGRPKDAEDCMKKWDNIFQNYKKVQRFQNASGRPDFFRLSNEERKEHNFKFRMERALSPRNMSTRGNTRGKKRDVVVDDNQGQGRGRWQAPKAKRLRTEDASAWVPCRGAQGWVAAVEGDYDDEFTTEEEQAEVTTFEVRESGRQRSSDHTASKRMLTPPPEAQQLRGRETRTEKAPAVDLGGDDDEPLERRRIRIRTIATPPSEVAVRVAANERPVSGRLPAMPCQPRQHNKGGNGGSAQRGGGGEVVADARTVGAEEGGAAGAGGSGTVAAVAMAGEEAPVGVTAREEARGERKGDREAGEPGSSRVHRSVMTKDLIDRAVLWVDDKAFWTTVEGRRLYNIVHEMREYFVAIASGLPPPTVPRSVVLPKSSTRVGRIVDQSQLQQAISCAVAVENVGLCILHGWVFKSGNRPRGYHMAFQYSLESFATNIARAMWYGEEWCDVVSPTVCAHTIDLSMDLPLWFAGANIEDRPDDDDMAAH